MQRLAKAVEQVAALKEESNFVWRNSQRIRSELVAEGLDEKEAEYLSTVRVFSNASGNYGSGVEDAVFASDTWESDRKIADLYLSRMGYFYGSDNSRWGQQLERVNLYAKQLSGTDVAMFSRSSNVYGVLKDDAGEPTGELMEMAAKYMAYKVAGNPFLGGISEGDLGRFGQAAVNCGVTARRCG